ncbi:competence protein CoiA family protein [Paraburkholderia tagetis]|uniref:competence protein CoiA family protein n=1 Tax=Paraburkholderia tagetis TaxID=2913261 RepID=UPI001EE48D9A|nr:competence protein CoiA family protein [Paraburkholderia tagetis]
MTIPFALDPLGHLVAARDLPKLAPGPFRCAACQSPVILKQGETRTWHFSHSPGSDCASGFETSLHLLAKQILLEHRHLRSPALICVDDSSLREDITVCEEHTIRWDVEGEAEKWMDSIRPDFVVDCGEQLLIVEVIVTHEVDAYKLAQLERLATPALAIDLSDVERDVTVDALTERIVETAAGKRWLFYPGWAEALAILDARLKEDEARLAEEEAEAAAAFAAERATVLARQAAARLKVERANELFRQAPDADKMEFLARKLTLAERDWPTVLGGSVRCASSVKARTRIWQADVFRKFIHGQRSLRSRPALTVDAVAAWLTQRYAVLPTASTSLRVAVRDFLCLLETHGYLRRKVSEEFEILKDALSVPGQTPRYVLHPAAAATRGLFWTRNYLDESKVSFAAEQSGVSLSLDAARRLIGNSSFASISRTEAEFAHSVSVAFQLPLEKAAEFLVAAGIFVRVC